MGLWKLSNKQTDWLRVSGLGLCFSLVLFFVWAGAALADEIVSLDTEVEAQESATCHVRETISVKLDNGSRYFERRIPIAYTGLSQDGVKDASLYHLGFRLIKVSQGQGRPVYFQLKQGAKEVVLRISTRGSGRQGSDTMAEFKVEYLLRRAFTFDKENSQLKLSLTGPDCPYNANYVSMRVTFPRALQKEAGKLKVFLLDGREQIVASEKQIGISGMRLDKYNNLAMVSVANLARQTPVEAVFQLPAGIVERPGFLRLAGQFMVDWYPLFLLPALTIFALLSFRFNYKVQPLPGLVNPEAAATNPEAAATHPETEWGNSEKLPSPVIVSAVLTGHLSGKAEQDSLPLAALELACRGYLKILVTEGEGGERRLRFHKGACDPQYQLLSGFERSLIEHLLSSDGSPFAQGEKLTQLLSDMEKFILDEDVFFGKPGAFRSSATVLGLIMAVLGLFLTATLSYLPAGPWGLGLLAAGVTALVLARFMPVYTRKGQRLRLQLLAQVPDAEGGLLRQHFFKLYGVTDSLPVWYCQENSVGDEALRKSNFESDIAAFCHR